MSPSFPEILSPIKCLDSFKNPNPYEKIYYTKKRPKKGRFRYAKNYYIMIFFRKKIR